MTKKTIRNAIRGLALIAFAVCLLLSKSNIFTDMPMVKIAVCIIMALFFGEQLLERSFVGMAIPVGVVACLFREELLLGDVHYAIIMIAVILIGIGLSTIFGHKPHHINVIHNGKERTVDVCGNAEYWEDEGTFDLDNSLGSKTQYIKINDMKKGTIDNALGQLTVYFNGTTVDPDGAELDIDNGLGSLSVYFPKEFRVSFNCDNGMGRINMHGECSQDMSQPLIKANVDNGMGQIDFYFE
ncbi:hypothetical protein SAMN04487831_11123 [Pseudobutyrivibrio sp. UC1225]|uniref:LiaF transmembrane domain-containing protein n=1 Tax=Pseudobutyrivibrio sp. UC1225 TaxID=1798185 RepID=UPI0008E6DEA4|nr:hypothetical protein [Pseudobutyrivibrio sp. UC1225]SFO18834.1 hypothetical protein SAMN04487831_11123 [Pseudobutyrivibrio sp. UC1225]